jgi:hypothetical protein
MIEKSLARRDFFIKDQPSNTLKGSIYFCVCNGFRSHDMISKGNDLSVMELPTDI